MLLPRHLKHKATFKTLHAACRDKNSFSVQEVCQRAGISYVQIQEWAQYDELWKNILEVCRSICFSNADDAGLMGRISSEMAIKYMSESEDES